MLNKLKDVQVLATKKKENNRSGNLGASILGISQDHTKPTSMINVTEAQWLKSSVTLHSVPGASWHIQVVDSQVWGSFPKNEQNRLGALGDLLVIHH